MASPPLTEATLLETPRPRALPTLAWTDASGPRQVTLDGVVTAGSAPGVGVVLDDRTVSRLHAELEVRGDGLWVRDLGSRNGTSIAGIKIERARVPHEAVLKVGGLSVFVSYAPPSPPSDVWPEASFGPLLGRTAVMRELFAKLARLAPSPAPVLVTGETGTGKELVAQALHEASGRADGPFVVVDCGALPAGLLETELFGHARGAFTGAVTARAGAFEEAHGGTLFLDEIGELPLALQPKLLRALEAKTVRRVGETEHRPVDLRIVAATHRDLRRMVNEGTFREDLYFRLAVLPVRLPPLRERAGDVPLLLDRFLAPASSAALDPDVLAELARRALRGNVRELRNFAERARAVGLAHAASVLDEGGDGAPSDGAEPRVAPSPSPSPEPGGGDLDPSWLALPFKEFRERWILRGERAYVAQALEASGRNVPAAARASGLERTYFFRLTKKLGF